jgi:hypothetical protein
MVSKRLAAWCSQPFHKLCRSKENYRQVQVLFVLFLSVIVHLIVPGGFCSEAVPR